MTKSSPECPRQEQILAYAGERLAPDEAEDFERHFFACDTCWRELEARLVLRDAFAEEDRFTERRFPRRAWLASAATLAVLAGGLWFWRVGVFEEREGTLRGGEQRLRLSVETRGDRVLAEWETVPGTDVYRVEAFAEAGTVLFATETRENRLEISHDDVAPGDRVVYWRVQALDALRRSLADSALIPME